jgi:hypothetical protein
MKTIHVFLVLATVCALLVGGAPKTAVSNAAPVIAVDDVGAAANQELAAARRATAKYHDIEQAIADGYVQTSPCIPGEGFHFRHEFPFDCEFDPENPEMLHYIPKPNGELKLVSVEYFVPVSAECGTLTQPPEGFSGDADVWGKEMGGIVWNLNAWVWFGNPDGVFEFANPKINCD